jgi:hypothetical protein
MRITIEWTERKDDRESLVTTDPWAAQSVLEHLCGQDQRGNRMPGSVTVENGEKSWTREVDAHWCRGGFCMNGNHYSWEDMDFTAEIEEYEENNNTDDDGEQVTEAARLAEVA